MRRRENDLVHKSRTGQPGQIAYAADHAIAQRPLIVEEPADSSAIFGMSFDIGGHAAAHASCANNQHIAQMLALLRTSLLPDSLPTPDQQRIKMQEAGSAEQSAYRPGCSLQAVSEAEDRCRP